MGDGDDLRVLSRAALLDMEDLAVRGTEVIYVLTYPEGVLDLYQSPHSELVMWLYSSLENLVEACGAGQPYVRAAPEQVVGFAEMLETPVLAALDVWHPEGSRYPEPDVREVEPLEPMEAYAPDQSVMWIPTRPVRVGDLEVGVEVHCNDQGVPLLAVFTSIEALRESCGPYQAASAIRSDRVEEVAWQAGAQGVVFDPMLADSARYNAPRRDWTRRNRLG